MEFLKELFMALDFRPWLATGVLVGQVVGQYTTWYNLGAKYQFSWKLNIAMFVICYFVSYLVIRAIG